MDDALLLAFERAAGRPADGSVPEAVLAFAREVVEAGRRALALPACPTSLVRRAEALFDRRASARRAIRAVKVAILDLLFDSWSEPAGAPAASRGSSRARFLRYGARPGGRLGGGATLDVEIAPAADGGVRVRGAFGASGSALPSSGLRVHASPTRGRAVSADVRAGGAFGLDLPAGSGDFVLTVRSGRRPVLRTGRIPPDARGRSKDAGPGARGPKARDPKARDR